MTALSIAADRTRFLRLALNLDAVVTGVNGLVYLAAAGPVAELLGPGAGVLRGIGLFLLVYAAAVAFIGTRPVIGRNAVLAVITLNAVWAAGSVVAVVAGLLEFTTPGVVWALAQALVVAAFAELQFMGLRKSTH
jgi:uncharacterized protein YjeT (DUF2065 family)